MAKPLTRFASDWLPCFDFSREREHPEGSTEPFEIERQMASKTTNPLIFLQQVRSETMKVTWPSRRETLISTVMVVIFAIIAMVFFFVADQLMAYAIDLILGLGR
jgi:preprotein translocase subunit SecE